jgi:hypothetical protein
MRKFILIAALALVSATAQAGQSRSLTMASNDETAAVEQQPASAEAPAAAEAGKPADAPKFVERPPAVEPAKAAPEKSTQIARAEKPKRRHESTEARVIYKLHRHGIYW